MTRERTDIEKDVLIFDEKPWNPHLELWRLSVSALEHLRLIVESTTVDSRK